jgi:hypothetical protein
MTTQNVQPAGLNNLLQGDLILRSMIGILAIFFGPFAIIFPRFAIASIWCPDGRVLCSGTEPGTFISGAEFRCLVDGHLRQPASAGHQPGHEKDMEILKPQMKTSSYGLCDGHLYQNSSQ